MEFKFTDILCSIAEYNGLEKYDTDYDGGALVSYQTFMKNKPQKAVISENQKKMILDMLSEKYDVDMDTSNLNGFNPYNYENRVLKFDTFLKEIFQKRPPQDPDYDDRPRQYSDDDDEEEE